MPASMFNRSIEAIADLWVNRWRARRSGGWPAVQAVASTAAAAAAPVVVVTGGTRGIGLALARRFAADGHNVLLVGRNETELQAAARDIEAHFRVTAVALATDLATAAGRARIDSELAARALYCDVLVNAAGVGLAGAFDSHDFDAIARLTAVNIDAVTELTWRYLPGMRARGRGGIINIASLGGLAPGPYQAAYYASKAYVLSLTEAIAAEIAGEGVRITAIAPGPVATGFHARMAASSAFYLRLIPQMGPEAVARSAYLGFRLGRSVVVPGIFNALMFPAMRILPHPLLNPIVRALLKPRHGGGHARSERSG